MPEQQELLTNQEVPCTSKFSSILKPEYYIDTIVNAIRSLILLFYWVLFMPFFELFISVFYCDGETHYLMKDLGCFGSNHIIYCVFAAIGLLFLLFMNIVIALLYNETQPVKEDSLSRLESTFEILMLFYRVFVSTFTLLCHNQSCSWVLIIIYLVSSFYLSYQYFIQIPYYDRFVSIFFGSMINIFAWISVNCLLTKFTDIQGHLIIIFCGVPIVVYFVTYLRERRIELLLNQNLDKINTDIDAMIQINTIKDLSISKIGNKTVGDNVDREMQVKGVINVHLEECRNEYCICKNLEELYDVGQQSFLTPTLDLHNEPIFVHHYNKKLFEEALNKFINSPNLHISFAFYLFQVMKNIHSALHELSVASKKKPTIQQQFTIFRYKNMIEQFTKKEEYKNKHIYQQLTNVKEFERLHGEMQKQIEAVCNYQVEFWTHLTTVVPDLNVLNELGNKTYNASENTDNYWKMLSHINPNYQPALTLYGEYLSFIKNHPQLGKPYIERAQNTNFAHNSMDEGIKRSDVLFSEDCTVVHITGNKESSGRVLKTSQGLLKCFGYNKSEVVGHNISFLMPAIIGGRHNEFLEKFYKTGRQRVFNLERAIFAQNRQGHCFRAKVLVKTMPSLKEGIQYVGMIRPVFAEYDYIITDLNGNIDCFSKGITSLLGLNPQLFKENNDINIQLICPELMEIFEQRRKLYKLVSQKKVDQKKVQQPAFVQVDPSQIIDPDQAFIQSKVAQAGGDVLAIIIPQNFAALAKSEKSTKQRGNSKKKNGGQDQIDLLGAQKVMRSPMFREFMKYLSKGRTQNKKCPDIKKLLNCKEYKENEKLKIVQCEMDLEINRLNRSDHNALKYLVFRIHSTQNQKHDMNDGEDQDIISLQDDQDQNQQIKNASNIIQEIFGQKDENGNLLRMGTNQHGFSQSATLKRQMTNNQNEDQNDSNNLIIKSNLRSGNKIINSLGNNLQEIDIRRESQMIIGSKKVGFADEVSKQNVEIPRPKVSKDAAPISIQPSLTFVDKSEDETITDRKQYDNQSFNNAKSGRDELDDSQVKQDESQKKAKQSSDKESQDKTEGPDDQMIFNGQIKQAPKPLQEQQNLLTPMIKPNQEDKDTPRIDVKKDIQISEKTKMRTSKINDQLLIKEKSSLQNIDKPADNQSSTPSQSKNSPLPSYKSSSLKSQKQSLKQVKQIKTGDQQPLLENNLDDQDDKSGDFKQQKDKSENQKALVDQSEGDQSVVDLQEDFEEEIEEIIEEIDEGAEDDADYGDEDNQDVMSGSRTGAISTGNDKYGFQGQGSKGILFGNPTDNFNPFAAAVLPPPPQKKRKLRNYDKIVTNKNYRQYDVESCTSALFKDYEFTNDELDIRDLIKKVEGRKQRRETKRKKQLIAVEEEQKKQAEHQKMKKKESKALSDGDQEDEDKPSDEEAAAADPENNQQQHEESPDEDEDRNDQQRMLKEDLDHGEVSSIASSIFSQTRSYFSLRNAIDEQYFPLSIKNLKIISNILFAALLIVELVQFIIQQQLFEGIHENVKNIKFSEKRIFDIIDINLRIQNLRFQNEKLFVPSTYFFGLNESQFIQSQNALLQSSTTSLKDNQNNLQFNTANFDYETRLQINPTDVILQYEDVPDLPGASSQNIWENIMSIVVFSQELTAKPLMITSNATDVKFIQNNCLNTLLVALKESTTAIISATQSKTDSSKNLFLSLLVGVTCALFFAMAFLLPVINKAKKSKQNVLKLFLLKKVEKAIDDQLKLCRWFITKYQVQSENLGAVADGGDGNDNIDDNMGGMSDKELKKEKEELYSLKKQKKNKKWKKLNTNFGLLGIRVIVIVCILEAFFIVNYLVSDRFMNQVGSLTGELRLLISRQPLFAQILLVQKELIYTNSTAHILNMNVKDLVTQLNDQLINEEQQLLELFQQNYDLHDTRYNTDFTNLAYSNMCSQITFQGSTKEECENFNLGILKKGLYSTITKYLSNLRDINSRFEILRKNNETAKDYINDWRIALSERTCDLYMKQIHLYLETLLMQEIDRLQENILTQKLTYILQL
eukprot:403348965